MLGLFPATCHAAGQDTLIFVAAGDDAWMVLGVRLPVAALLVAALANWRRKREPRRRFSGPGERGRIRRA